MRVRILGIGMGPQHLTPEVAGALAEVDYVVAAEKGEGDHLLDLRRAVCEAHGVELVVVPDPPRDRSAMGTPRYEDVVSHWHRARVAAYTEIFRERGGTAAFLVWGDPSLYDSSIRITAEAARVLDIEYDVLPGISAPQLLAARHRLVLHDIGRPVHVTTARRLREALAQGQDNVVVMLNRVIELDGLEDWSIWWGGNLGTTSEELVAGRVGDVIPEIHAARERARTAAGWVMDLYLLRGPS